MCIAGLVEEIDKSFSYVPYIGFSRTSREVREKLHNWLQRQRKDKDDQRKLESHKESEKPEEQSKRKNMFEDDSSEEESRRATRRARRSTPRMRTGLDDEMESHKNSKAVNSSDEELGSPK